MSDNHITSYSGTVRWHEPKAVEISWLDALTYRPRSRSEQNGPYILLGQALIHLGRMGASDKQLQELANKGKDLTLKDIAKVYCKNIREGDGWDG